MHGQQNIKTVYIVTIMW